MCYRVRALLTPDASASHLTEAHIMKPNPFKFQVIEFSRQYPYGVENRIVAQAATLKGCLSEYSRHVARYAGEPRNIVKTVFKADGVVFDVV